MTTTQAAVGVGARELVTMGRQCKVALAAVDAQLDRMDRGEARSADVRPLIDTVKRMIEYFGDAVRAYNALRQAEAVH